MSKMVTEKTYKAQDMVKTSSGREEFKQQSITVSGVCYYGSDFHAVG
jgi:hypothetical protein